MIFTLPARREILAGGELLAFGHENRPDGFMAGGRLVACARVAILQSRMAILAASLGRPVPDVPERPHRIDVPGVPRRIRPKEEFGAPEMVASSAMLHEDIRDRPFW